MKHTLENTYDLPFHVTKGVNEYTIYPENDMDELFEIHVQFRSDVRMIAEIKPQKHAAAMLNDMANASEEQKKRFMAYVKLFKERNAKVSTEVNGEKTDLSDWPASWKNLAIRISKIEEKDILFDEEAKKWAVDVCGMMLSLLNVESMEGAQSEGKKFDVVMTKYERNPVNRALCIEINGCKCKICGFDFEKAYGELGKGFIHVHHIIPISKRGGEYIPDPGTDLIPVCPNCHAMLHRREPPYGPDDVKSIMNNLI